MAENAVDAFRNYFHPDRPWIGIDWGTTNIRAYLIEGDQIRAETSQLCSIQQCAQTGWAQILHQLQQQLHVEAEIAVLISGMAGSKYGWREAPYHACPADPVSLCSKGVSPEGFGNVLILPGLSYQDEDGNFDVMRGEEIQALGYFSLYGDEPVVICAPGTHTKWMFLQDGKITQFSTSITGELFSLLSTQSILSQSIEISEVGPPDAAFQAGVAQVARGRTLLADLFKVRANNLLGDLAAEQAAEVLSGILIGSDVANSPALTQGVSRAVPIIGPRAMAERYQMALHGFGREAEILDASSLTIAGLMTAARSLSSTDERCTP